MAKPDTMDAVKTAAEPTREALAAALEVCERERDAWAARAAAIEAGLEPAAVAVATEPMPEVVEPEVEPASKKGSAWRGEWGKSEDEPEAVEPELVTAIA